ncbi:hypothetical protein L195_g057575, partial [Trifolium pratense]
YSTYSILYDHYDVGLGLGRTRQELETTSACRLYAVVFSGKEGNINFHLPINTKAHHTKFLTPQSLFATHYSIYHSSITIPHSETTGMDGWE